jgi:hypothetical protein
MARSARLAVVVAALTSAAVAIESPPPVGGAQPGGESPPTGNTGPPRGERPPAPAAARIAKQLKKIRVVADDAATTLPLEVKR